MRVITMSELATDEKWSYSSSEKIGPLRRASEIWNLYRSSRRPTPAVNRYIAMLDVMGHEVAQRTAKTLSGLRALDIGPGQKLGLMRCLCKDNEVVGIDTDVILQGLSLRDCTEMLKHNSALRVAKTLGRKALGIDAAFNSELARRLGVKGFPRLPVLRMDATAMEFPSDHFDLAYSFSVFEHIDRPREALAEVARVLKPGGVAYVSLHLYTSHSGCHLPAMLKSPVPQPPYWPHLRPEYQSGVQPTAFLNKVSLKAWMELFGTTMPGAWIVREQQRRLEERLKALREQGELAGYSDEELLTVNVVAIWQKGNEADKGAPEVHWVP